MFTHLGVPKVCSHTREVEFDSQQDHPTCRGGTIDRTRKVLREIG